MEPQSVQTCPRCSAQCPRFAGYPVWCSACGWNVEPLEPDAPDSIAELARARAGAWMAASILGEVSRASQRRLGPYRLAVYAYAALAYLLVAAFLAGGVALIALKTSNIFLDVVGVVCIGIAWVARPRMLEPPEEIADRAEFGTLYEVTDRVSDALGAHRVSGIVIDDDYNASFGRYGWRGRRILTLGLPLLSILEPQERAAVVAHEVAHDVNGDPSRSLFVSGAYNALIQMYHLFAPQRVNPAYRHGAPAMVTVGGRFANLVLAGIAFLIRPFLRLFALLMMRDRQRAEYLADGIAADIAGDEAARAALRKAHLAKTFDGLAMNAAAGGEATDLLGRLRRWVADAPPSEWQRIDRIMSLDRTQIDSSHPPTAERIRFLEGRPASAGRVMVSRSEQDSIDRELMPLERRFTEALVEAARSRLYHR